MQTGLGHSNKILLFLKEFLFNPRRETQRFLALGSRINRFED